MIDLLTLADRLRYEALKKTALTEPLAFRMAARQHAAKHPRSLRRLLRRASTKDTSAYALFVDWTTNLLPKIEALDTAAKNSTFATALSKQLQLSRPAAIHLAERLATERQHELYEDFLTFHYGNDSRARKAAASVFTQPSDSIALSRDHYVSYYLHYHAAAEAKLTFYDANAPLLRRWRLAQRERRQVRRYLRAKAKRLVQITDRQQAIKAQHGAIIGRILSLEFDTVLALDAYRTYKKRLDALKPTSKTPAKTLSLFTAATENIREAYASTLTSTDKLADLQHALKEVDAVLVELFDMTDRGRNSLMTNLKEYRDLDREATRITKERAAYSDR